MHFSPALCRLPPFARLVPSVRLSVTSRSTAKTVRDRPMVTTGSLWEVTTGLFRGGNSSPSHYDNHFPQTGGLTPQSKLTSQIAAKRCQIQRLFVLTAYGNIELPYLTVPSLTPRGIHSRKGSSQKLNSKLV